MQWHTTATSDVLKELNTTSERGLTQHDAEQRLQQAGPNELVDRGTKNPWKILLEQFTSAMVLILMRLSLLFVRVKSRTSLLSGKSPSVSR